MLRGRTPPKLKLSIKLAVCAILLTTVATAIVAGAGHEISVPGSTEIPTQTVETDEFEKDEYEIDAFAVQEQGESFTADVNIPDDADGEVIVDLYGFENGDQQYLTTGTRQADGEEWLFDSEATDREPGTYALLLFVDDDLQKIQPVVISGYDIDVDNPTSGDEDEEITVDATVTQTDADSDPSQVNVVIWNDDDQRQIEMSSGDDSTSYTADISLNQFDPGEYEVYVTAHGDEEFQGEKEVLGLGEGSVLDIEEVEDDTDDSTDDNTNGGGDSSGTSGGGAAGGGGISPVASESRSIADDTPSEPGMTVQFNQGAVNSVTFSEGQEGGSIDVEEYDGTPPGAPDTGDRPVMEGVVITPSEEYRNTAATIEITVDQTEVLRADATAEDLAVLKATDTGYQTLDTDVVADNGDVTLAAETPGFSAFIVSTNEGDIDTSGDGDTATGSGDDTGSTGTAESDPDSDSSSDDVMQPSNGTESEPAEPEGQAGFGLIVSVLSLLLVTLLAKHRHRA